MLGILRRDEVTRDAATLACTSGMTAALARVQQQQLEYLNRMLVGEMTVLDGHGAPVVIPAIQTALQQRQIDEIARIRARHAGQQQQITARLDAYKQMLDKRSAIFERALLYDDTATGTLETMVQEMRTAIPKAPPLDAFLAGHQDLDATISALMPLLPSYAESGSSLTRMLSVDADKRELVLRLLRQCRPFTPLDRVVEDQQGLRNRRDFLVILAIPGGQDGPLAEVMLQGGIVESANQIVDAGEDEIRLYYLREGLPYAAIRPLAQYKERHDVYCASPSAITPYTVADAQQLPDIEPARTNLRTHTETLIYLAKAVLPRQLSPKPAGGFQLQYDRDNPNGFATSRVETFPTFEALVSWLAPRVDIRRGLERNLREVCDTTPEAYSAALVAAWQQASGEEREYLQDALFQLRVDPYRFNGCLDLAPSA